MVKAQRKITQEQVSTSQNHISTKKIKKLKIQNQQGQREYKVKQLLPHEEYKILKSKKYQLRRKQTKQIIQIDKNQVKSAVQTLKKYEEKNESNLLLQEHGFIYIEIVISKVPQAYYVRPIQIELPYPIYSQQYNSKFAIVVTDPSSQYKDKIQDMNIPLIAEVIGYQKLKKQFAAKKDKKTLLYNFDLFFCDWQLYNILRKPTGSLFYQRKKIPFPIDCENVPQQLNIGQDYQAYLNNLGKFSYFVIGNGPVYTLKVARISMGLKQQVKNIIHGALNSIPHILGKLNASLIRQISIKTSKSPSLPIFNQLNLNQISSYKN